jgi:magnesium transporter
MVDGIEEELLSDEGNDEPEDVLGTLFHLKHELTALRRLAVPLREVVAVLMRPTTRLVPEESRMHYDDVRDHLIRVVDMIDTMRDYLAGSLDIYTTQQTQRINQSLQRLNAISTVILPLTFITSVYGMNFQNMQALTTRYGYFVVLAALGALMLY